VHDPRWSPDGRSIAYLAFVREPDVFEPGRGDDVYVIDSAGGTPRKITEREEPMHNLSWLPDGSTLVFGTGFNGGFQVNMVPIMGGSVFTFPATVDGTPTERLFPAVAPNGQWIAAIETKQVAGPSRQSLVLLDTSGGERREILEFGPDATPYLEPSWNPHEPALAFALGRQAVQVSPFGGELSVMVEAFGEIVSEISYSPDASMLAFAAWPGEPGRQRGGDAYLTIAPRNGAPQITLAEAGDATRTEIVWSPDGSRLVFSTGALFSEIGMVYAVNADGSELTPLVEARTGLRPGFDWIP
jgi:Tol biopolymer transport system component